MTGSYAGLGEGRPEEMSEETVVEQTSGRNFTGICAEAATQRSMRGEL